ncbi:MAG TPA: TetR/AcrR family transcriptional regulator [Pseudonocardia sp.]|jgi:AcrR family transcriptional regulator|nr:TetR/AcrR family transcriptional regulator [Pseudonocardia sp.]
MPPHQRRDRQRADRHRLILATARQIAETEGWDAVTTRRLAEAIEYSQPVLYSHFAGKDEIVAAVALDGFAELTEALRTRSVAGAAAGGQVRGGQVRGDHVGGGRASESRLGAVARAYLDFAAAHPAVYAAMFTLHTALTFATPQSPEPLRDAFGVLRDSLGEGDEDTGDERDLETRTEVFWAALHGLATLTAGHRLRPAQADERLDLLVAQLA